MTVFLHTPDDLPDGNTYDHWFATTGTTADLGSAKKLPELEIRLENAFKEIRELWWRLGKEMGAEPTAQIAQTPTAAAFGSDFGLMLAWAHLSEQLTKENESCLVVCSDPWLFHHLAGLSGVAAGRPPRLCHQPLFLRLRGMLSRCKATLGVMKASMGLQHLKLAHQTGDHVLLVYGHPRSDAKGHDDYFGPLMKELPQLKRLLHTDCPKGRALELSKDGKTASLHAWGSLFFALSLPFARWRPGKSHTRGPYGWLVRRAAAKENSGGGPAMNRWQHHCQKRWLAHIKPTRVAWPWENHGWERELCRAARKQAVATLGYQHTVIGPFQINYAIATNPDGLESVPDLVVSNGPAYREELAAWGVPADRLLMGGALRFKPFEKSLYDAKGPVFVPLSAIPLAAKTQVKAARALAATGVRTLVKEHPMYPLDFKDGPNLERTNIPLQQQSNLSAVLYSTGTSALEALLAGLPAYRLLLEDRIAIDVLPAQVAAESVTLDTVVEKVSAPVQIQQLKWEQVLAHPDMDLWRRLLSNDMQCEKGIGNRDKITP